MALLSLFDRGVSTLSLFRGSIGIARVRDDLKVNMMNEMRQEF